MRLFVASFLPAADADRYDCLIATLVAQYPDAVRPIPTGSAHFTHAFLGEVVGLSPVDLAEDIENATAGRPRIAIELGPPTALQVAGEPRLIMATVAAGADHVAALSEALVRRLRLRSALATLGRAKAPHATLARFNRQSSPRKRREVIGTLASWPQALTPSHVMGVDLVRSLLGPQGPQYHWLVHHPLA
jgi:2'-5' RNA ligase